MKGLKITNNEINIVFLLSSYVVLLIYAVERSLLFLFLSTYLVFINMMAVRLIEINSKMNNKKAGDFLLLLCVMNNFICFNYRYYHDDFIVDEILFSIWSIYMTFSIIRLILTGTVRKLISLSLQNQQFVREVKITGTVLILSLILAYYGKYYMYTYSITIFFLIVLACVVNKKNYTEDTVKGN